MFVRDLSIGLFIKTYTWLIGQCQFEQDLGSSAELKESLVAALVHGESVSSVCGQLVLLETLVMGTK